MNPSAKELRQILQTAESTARQAGQYLKKHFRKNNIHGYHYKKHREIVTRRDTDANKMIVKKIKRAFPEHNIISEEAHYRQNHSTFTWYVDPLDGTTNYTAGIPLYAVNIGVSQNNKIICGVIYLPDRDELYSATIGKGSFCNKKKIKVSKTTKIKDSFIQLCHSYEKENRERGAKTVKKLTNKVRVYRRFGCAGVEHSNVATGRADAIAIIGSRPWDNLAGAVIIREAGGRATDIKGNPWQADSRDFVASNGVIHERLLKLIR